MWSFDTTFEAIRRHWLNRWDEANLSLYVLRYDPADETLRQFIKCFKAAAPSGAADATVGGVFVEVASMLVSKAISSKDKKLREEYPCGYIAPIPSHDAGFAKPSIQAVCESVAAQCPWLQCEPQALERTIETPAAHQAQWGSRPSHLEHWDTIRYGGPPVSDAAGILLLDDIRTRGDISQACIHRVMQATGCRRENVIRVFLGRTGHRI